MGSTPTLTQNEAIALVNIPSLNVPIRTPQIRQAQNDIPDDVSDVASFAPSVSARPEAESGHIHEPIIEPEYFRDRDRERTKDRYNESVQQLQESLSLSRVKWESIQLPEFEDISENNDPIPQLRAQVEKALDMRKLELAGKGRSIFERIFTVMSPVTKRILWTFKEGSSVASSLLWTDNLTDICLESLWIAVWRTLGANRCKLPNFPSDFEDCRTGNLSKKRD